MRSQILGASLFLLILSGCSDVTPQVSVLRNKPTEDLLPQRNMPAETELSSTGVSTSTEGYQLRAVVSKENKGTPQVSTNGYKLVLDNQTD
ncbi:hypothetical protein [Bdellovibrio sp. HCB-110]|uniref:hypothetical protein n=1 Tax=Bdellovibrio sp. HCB-110 TaxID=3391182 RepID=UPI0039B41FD1